MELTNQSDKFRDFIQTSNHSFSAKFVHDTDSKYKSALALLLSYSGGYKNVGLIHASIPAKTSKDGLVLMRHDRLRVKGEIPINIRYLRSTSNGNHRYEVTAVLKPTECVVNGKEVPDPTTISNAVF